MSGAPGGNAITLKDMLSFASIGATIFFGAMWLGSLSNEVENLKSSTVTDGRISRLEQRVDTLSDNTKELKTAINELTIELKRH